VVQSLTVGSYLKVATKGAVALVALKKTSWSVPYVFGIYVRAMAFTFLF